ncbi:unnamed protein product [Menidia menidia]|uniref:ditrans,polycis-polyprenyl diphosphate synthase [(2E,6E)-farnesyldiphosphate specific] n=1 Tax=Menidia menidia TaxID=238744 RepID=A0A8S4BDD7_9TELE|nr:unnamed protein product [Menidia menidia]
MSQHCRTGFFQKNNSLLQEAIIKQQQHLLGADRSKYSVELLKKGHDDPQQYVVSCRPTVKVLSPEDGKHSIVQAARQLCHSVETKQRSSRDIDVSMLDVLLRGTGGALLCSLPSHRKVSYEDLFGALQRYSACQQRLGQ